MLNTRIRIEMTWQIAIMAGLPEAPFSKIADFTAYAQGHLAQRFANYDAALRVDVVEDFESFAILKLTWDVNLDMVPGAWNQPEDHVALAKSLLVDGISHYGRRLTIDGIYREVDTADAPDHGNILTQSHAAGLTPSRDDFPIFRPEPHADWPEADEVFLQDGAWFWQVSGADKTPAAGPAPEKIFTLWDPERRYGLAA